jgi:hypothetical protein
MLNPTSKVPLALVFSGALVLGGCGGAESAWDDDDADRSVVESEQAEQAAEEAETPAAEPAPQAPAASQPAPPAARRDPPPPAPEVREEPAIPVGTQVSLAVESTLSTQNSQPGDIFHAWVTEEVIGGDGMVLIPEGARVRGEVTESRGTTSSDDEAVLGIRLTTLLLNGRELPIETTVTQTAIETSSADSGTRTATKVATGAAAGAVIGQILGRDTRATVQGAAAGAVAGTAVALATREGHAVLREGSLIVIRLDTRVPLVAQR